jgi:hypothetical protein
LAVVAVGRRAFQRALGHGLGDLGADRPGPRDQVRRDAEQLGLGLVGIGDETPFDHVGGAGDLGQGRGDQAAGAALGRGEPQARAPKRL